MQRVDTATAAAALPAQNAAGTPGYFTQGDPGSGMAATVPGQDWYNLVQEELMAVIETAGLTPDKADMDQLLEAIQILSGLHAGGVSKGCHDFAGLDIKNNAANPTYQVDIDADGGILYDPAGKKLTVTGVNLTVDITASGANGLDTGTEANVWYYLWVISNGSTVAGLISASAASPTLPGGYTFKALVGAVQNTAGNFVLMHQIGSRVISTVVTVLTGGTAVTPTSVTLDMIPPTAKILWGNCNQAAASDLRVVVESDSAELGKTGVAGSNGHSGQFCIPITIPQTMYYWTDAGGSAGIAIQGYGY